MMTRLESETLFVPSFTDLDIDAVEAKIYMIIDPPVKSTQYIQPTAHVYNRPVTPHHTTHSSRNEP